MNHRLHRLTFRAAVAFTASLAIAVSTGWVLAAAGEAVAFVPNELGRAMLYNERITR